MHKLFLIFLPLLVGCATVVSKKQYSIDIESYPDSQVTVRDNSGRNIYKSVTPFSVNLKSGYGVFDAAEYTFIFEKDGYVTDIKKINADIDAWYFGNIIFGWYGLLGFMVIDPVSGSMWEIDETQISTILLEKSN